MQKSCELYQRRIDRKNCLDILNGSGDIRVWKLNLAPKVKFDLKDQSSFWKTCANLAIQLVRKSWWWYMKIVFSHYLKCSARNYFPFIWTVLKRKGSHRVAPLLKTQTSPTFAHMEWYIESHLMPILESLIFERLVWFFSPCIKNDSKKNLTILKLAWGNRQNWSSVANWFTL